MTPQMFKQRAKDEGHYLHTDEFIRPLSAATMQFLGLAQEASTLLPLHPLPSSLSSPLPSPLSSLLSYFSPSVCECVLDSACARKNPGGYESLLYGRRP